MDFINRKWLAIWKGKPPGLFLLLINLSTSFIMVLPLIYIISRAVTVPLEKWKLLFRSRVSILMWNTISLAVTVAIFTTILGVILAWLTEHTDLPWKKYMRLLFVLPLVFPPYIGALTYIILFGKRGVMYSLIGSSIIDVFSFFSVSFILSMFTFPYTYLTVSAILKKISGNYDEASRSCGANYFTTFRKIMLPLLRPAILSSSMIIFFYIIADFGAVSMLRYTTFTSSIYFQIVGKLDRSGAAILSTLLIVFGFLVLSLKAKLLEHNYFYQNPKSNRAINPLKLGRFKSLAWLFILLVMFFSVILPLSTLIIWSVKAIHQSAVGINTIYYIKNSLILSISAAFITMILSLPVSYMKYRHPSKITAILNSLCHLGSIVPGILLALGIVFIINKYLPFLVGGQTILMLRPPGFDTLSVRLWLSTSDGFYVNAAPSGLFIVLASIIPLYYLLKKEKVNENGLS